MTCGLRKDIMCHAWPYSFICLLDHQIRHQTTCKVGCQSGDCSQSKDPCMYSEFTRPRQAPALRVRCLASQTSVSWCFCLSLTSAEGLHNFKFDPTGVETYDLWTMTGLVCAVRHFNKDIRCHV